MQSVNEPGTLKDLVNEMDKWYLDELIKEINSKE